MGLATLILGLAVFVGTHVFVTARERRAALIARLGEGPYKLVFSLLSIAGILLIAYGFGLYRRTGWVDLWTPPSWTRHIAVLLMWFACVMLVSAYVPGNITRALKHPMLNAVKVWALAHLVANGDLGSVILFGTLLLWAAYDRVAVKRRERTEAPRPIRGGWGNDAIAVAVGTIVYLALGFAFHPVFIGVPAFTS